MNLLLPSLYAFFSIYFNFLLLDEVFLAEEYYLFVIPSTESITIFLVKLVMFNSFFFFSVTSTVVDF